MPWKCLAILAALLISSGHSVRAQEPAPVPAPEPAAEVAKTLAAYVASFNAQDATQLAELWTSDGVYTDRTTGDQFVGRAAIEAEFQAVFARESVPTLAVVSESLDFVSPNVALARGTAFATAPDSEPIQSGYSVVYVKRDGQWLIDRVTEDAVAADDPGHEALQQLEFLIGEWIDEHDGVSVEMSCQWTENETYISRTYKVANQGEIQSSGLQIIGWDPATEQIRSWLFDSSGSFVSGSWARRDDKWVVRSVATLADGGRGSFTSVFRPQPDGTYTWEKINRVLDGELLPNVDETVIRRK